MSNNYPQEIVPSILFFLECMTFLCVLSIEPKPIHVVAVPNKKNWKRSIYVETNNLGVSQKLTYILTDPMKKSWWIKLTMPKLVYIKTLSIIHIIFGSTSCFVLNVVISIGTSAVDWWFTKINVRWSKAGVMSSPTSTTRWDINTVSHINHVE